jgi:uridine kinase
VVNSAMEYEMGVLKPLVEPLLASVPTDDAQYTKAQALLKLLGLFNPAAASRVPSTSVMREFIGDGAFDCH